MLIEKKQVNSKFIASLLGPTVVAVTVSEAINLRIWDTSLPQVVYLNGMILFSAGLGVVRFHNRWRPDWTVTITIFGWIVMLAGLFRLFFPNAEQAEATPVTYLFVAALGLLGLFWCFKGYR